MIVEAKSKNTTKTLLNASKTVLNACKTKLNKLYRIKNNNGNNICSTVGMLFAVIGKKKKITYKRKKLQHRCHFCLWI